MVQAAQENAQKSQNLLYHISLNQAFYKNTEMDPIMDVSKFSGKTGS